MVVQIEILGKYGTMHRRFDEYVYVTLVTY